MKNVLLLSYLAWSLSFVLTRATISDETLISRLLKDSNDQAAGRWSSLTPNLDFSRILGDSKYDKVTEQILDRTLATSTSATPSSSSCSFLPSSKNDYYPEYAIAWRFLGISVDCNYQGNGHRELQNNYNGAMCSRVILYAVVSADYFQYLKNTFERLFRTSIPTSIVNHFWLNDTIGWDCGTVVCRHKP